jgi:hypothetical protein
VRSLSRAGSYVPTVRRQTRSRWEKRGVLSVLLHKPLVNSANPLIWSLCRNYSQNGVGFHPTLSVYRFPGQESSSVSVKA